jgi:hypothetical protein
MALHAILLCAAALLPSTLAAASPPQIVRNMTGVATPYYVAANTKTPSQFVVRGTNFGRPEDQPEDLRCRAKFTYFSAGDNATHPLGANGSMGPAKVLNDTAILCTGMGPSLPGGRAGIAVESPSHSDPKKKIWWSHGVADAVYSTLVEVTPDRRPYLSNETSDARLLVALDLRAVAGLGLGASAYRSVELCAELRPARPNPMLPSRFELDASLDGLDMLPCRVVDFDEARTLGAGGLGAAAGGFEDGAVFALPFDPAALAKLPEQVAAAVVRVRATLRGDGGRTLEMLPMDRRFAVAPASQLRPGQGVSTVDHARRMVRFNGEPWLGAGFYLSSSFVDRLQKPPKPTPASMASGKRALAAWDHEGLTQVMSYELPALPPAERADVLAFMEKDLGARIKFDYMIVAQVKKVLASEPGTANFTAAWREVEAAVAVVRDHPALLGYYICDDCNQPEIFPPLKMSQLYGALKALDPFHVTLGAPWMNPWALFVFGESAGYLSLDYAQMENYRPFPADHVTTRDALARAGMLWEPVANSPPGYVLQGDSEDGKKPGHLFPAQLEATLSWLGAVQFGAPNVVNFVVESLPTSASDTLDLDRPAHVDAQGAYARAARRLLPAMLPDLTDPAEGTRLGVRVARSSTCTQPGASEKLPRYDFARDASVVAGAFRQSEWASSGGARSRGFCAFVVVANLCPSPSTFQIDVGAVDGAIDAGIVAEIEACPSCRWAQHEFFQDYNVTATPQRADADGFDGLALAEDTVGGYETVVLRVGCEGWSAEL